MKSALFSILLTLFISVTLSLSARAMEASGAVEDQTVDEQQSRDQKVRDSLIGSRKDQNFYLHKLNYAIANDEDLLLQYSFKYRVIGTAQQ